MTDKSDERIRRSYKTYGGCDNCAGEMTNTITVKDESGNINFKVCSLDCLEEQAAYLIYPGNE